MIPVHLDMQEAFVGDIAPAVPQVLDEFTGDGITWQLISMVRNSDGTLSGMIHVINHRQEVYAVRSIPPYGNWNVLLVNGVQTASNNS